MKKIIVSLFCGLLAVGALADDLSNPAVYGTNAVYASVAGRALTSDDGTNALAQLATATGRVAAAEALLVTTTGRVAALEVVDVTTTGRVAVLEASKVVVTGQVAALQAVDISTTARVAAVEYKVGALMTNTYVSGILTNESGEFAGFTTTSHVFYLTR